MVKIPDDIVIFGTKFEAEKVAYIHSAMGGDVKYVIDSYIEGNFHGVPIYKREQVINLREYFIIVAVERGETYKEIKEILIKSGLKEFYNFIWSFLCYRKLVVINANCHGNALQRYLESSEQFNIKYAIYPLAEIQNNNAKEIDEMLLKVTDVYIHQDIRSENKIGYKLSDEYIIPRLNHSCKNICIPNLVGFGKCIFQTQTDEIYMVMGDKNYPLFYKDTLIENAYREVSTKTVDNILEYIVNYKFDKTSVKEEFESCLKSLYKREKNWDVKIAKYIEENYYTKKLFNDINHPSDLLMLKICETVAKLLEIEMIYDSRKIQFGMGLEAFIWSGIIDILKISVNESEVRKGLRKQILGNINKMNLKEFIREYIWCVYGEYLT